MESLLTSNSLPFVDIYLMFRTFYFRRKKQPSFGPYNGQAFIVYSFDNRYRIILHIISVFCSFGLENSHINVGAIMCFTLSILTTGFYFSDEF